MATVVKNTVKYEHYFDPSTKRHHINGIQSVLHCHHYAALYTQLAIDANETALLQECARNSFREVLKNYLAENPDVDIVAKKVDIACQYYALLGLGKMSVIHLGEDSGEIELLSSHIDDGWKKKWGEYDRPINYISAGYIEALFEEVLQTEAHAFSVSETQSIVMGADTSTFSIVRR
jgi:hypothetical protein